MNRIRTIDTVRGAQHVARKLSTVCRVRKKSVVLLAAGAIVFLTCSMGLAASHPETGVWIHTQSALGNARSVQLGGYYDASQRQHRHREHLPQWFREHQNLSPEAQEQALRNEPGFDRLSPQEQERLFRRLRQLDAMPPDRRERTLQRMEALERLSPSQRQQVRAVLQDIRQMPRPRRHMMRQAFRSLSQLQPAQRQAIINSPQFRIQFSHEERQMLRTLMSVQPYSPQSPPAMGLK